MTTENFYTTAWEVMEKLGEYIHTLYNTDLANPRVQVFLEDVVLHEDLPYPAPGQNIKTVELRFDAIGRSPAGREITGGGVDFPARVMIDVEIWEATVSSDEDLYTGETNYEDLVRFISEITGGLYQQRIPDLPALPIDHRGGAIMEIEVQNGVRTAYVLPVGIDCLLHPSAWLLPTTDPKSPYTGPAPPDPINDIIVTSTPTPR